MPANRILIVEDERIVALNLQQRLTKLGYEVTGRAASGLEALAKARQQRPDLVLMDIHIEGDMDGIETARRLKEELNLRVIYLTAYAEDSTLERARETQPYGYLIKPFSERELHATLQVAMERQSLDLALAESEERGRLALESASMGSWEFAPGRSELRTFGLATQLLGGGEGGVLALETLLACVHPEDRVATRQAVEQAGQSLAPCALEFRQLAADGSLRWIRVVAKVFTPAHGGEVRLIGVAQDVTERRATETRLHQAATVFNETQEGIFILDEARELVSANPAYQRLIGATSGAAIGQEVRFLTPQVLTVEQHASIWAALASDGVWQGEARIVRDDGVIFPARLSLTAARSGEQGSAHYVGIVSDFTELRAAQDALRKLAHYDPLTGLPNRLLMQDRLEQAINRARRRNTRIAVLFADLDHFKRINDTHGHAVGDLVLREAAQRIGGGLRSADTAARLGGDEFLVILEDFTEIAHVITVTEKLAAVMAKPVTVGGHALHIGASIGIALFPEDGQSMEQLIQKADTAMYEAKMQGRGSHAFYSPQMTLKVARYLVRDQQIRQAVERGELRLHYQPQIELASGRCTSVEALVRWQHPERGLLGAAELIPAAEENGLILDIGSWVLREACAQGQRWRMAGLPPLRMAVNVSAKQILSGQVAAEVAAALRDTGFDPSLLEIEITESALQCEGIAIACLNEIRRLGASIAIDDFGTGYSCLASLKHLPLDRLKIDRSFVNELPLDGNSVVLAETILSIGSRLGLKVTAEGVETVAQLNFLCERGCSDVQGFLFSPAVSADGLVALLKRMRQNPAAMAMPDSVHMQKIVGAASGRSVAH